MSSKKQTWGMPIALLSAICLVAMGFIPGNALATDLHKTKLVGHSDLQGRNSLQVTVKTHPNGKVFAFAGHHRGVEYNPVTDTDEDNGTTILDVTNPKKPKFIVHIPGAPTAEGRATQVAYNHLGSGNDYLIRQQEILGAGPPTDWFEIWNITATLNDGTFPTWITNIADKYPPGSTDPLTQTHKGWWHVNNTTGESYYFGSATDTVDAKPNHQHMIIWDLSNIGTPTYVASGWIFGQQVGEPDAPEGNISLHHPVVDWANKRVHGAFLFGGNVVVWDISSLPTATPLDPMPEIFNVDYNPPYPDPGPHTSLPFYQVDTPNFTPGNFPYPGSTFPSISNPRDYILVSDEGFRGDVGGVACQDIRNHLFTIDITHFNYPVNVAAFKVPDGDFCENGKSVRPHQFADTQDGKLYDVGANNGITYVAYFSKGLRIIDYSDPYNPKEVGHYIPQTTSMTKLNANGVKTILTNDVDLDSRGLAYTTDRAGTGLHIIEFLGE
ncbi:MAG: LVIVD repeat-containing protein [Planctomycetota bacterium]